MVDRRICVKLYFQLGLLLESKFKFFLIKLCIYYPLQEGITTPPLDYQIDHILKKSLMENFVFCSVNVTLFELVNVTTDSSLIQCTAPIIKKACESFRPFPISNLMTKTIFSKQFLPYRIGNNLNSKKLQVLGDRGFRFPGGSLSIFFKLHKNEAKHGKRYLFALYQQRFTCSKATMETLEKGAKYVVYEVLLVPLLLILNIFETFF